MSTVSADLIAELQDVIDALGRDVIAAQRDMQEGLVRPERINAMFRQGHTLKGLFGMAGVKGAQRLAHGTEDLLESMRMGRAAVTRETLAVLLDCVDHCGQRVESGLSVDVGLEAQVEPLLARLHHLSGHKSTQASPPGAVPVPKASPLSQASPMSAAPREAQVAVRRELPPELRRMLTEYEEYRYEESKRTGRHLMAASVALSLMDCDTALPALEGQLAALGEIIARLPSAQLGADGSIVFDILVAADTSADEVAEKLGRPDVTVRSLAGNDDAPQAAPEEAVSQSPALAAGPAPQEPKAPAEPGVAKGGQEAELPEAPPGKAAQTVRVDIRRLDRLMHLVGELGATRSVLGRLAVRVREETQPMALAAELEREGARLERRISMLQAQVLEARMVPLTPLFERLVRAGTKVALELGIEAHFSTVGGHTELDKRIVEELADPLLHLMRNAIDHGLELPHERTANNKPAHGTVRLWAQAQGSHVVVGVGDDGGGIDDQAVAQEAVDRGLITQERAKEMSVDERLRLILLPGFSTREEVSEYSGRGVGLDVVKTHLERLGGAVEITTVRGQGSSFTLMAPVTLAILPALVVVAGGAQYAIPLAQVVETVGIEAAMVSPAQGQPTLRLRDTTLALTPLTDVLLPNAAATADRPDAGAAQLPYAVIVGQASRQTALAVTDVLGQQDIVLKPLGRRLGHIRGLAGAAVVDDRTLILVLDAMSLSGELRAPAAVLGQEGAAP